MAENENDLESYNFEDLLSGDDLVVMSDDYTHLEDHALIDTIILNYFSQKPITAETVEKINYNSDFKKTLLFNIQNRLEAIEDDYKFIHFKDLHIIFNLLSLGKNYNMFGSHEDSSLYHITRILKDYEDLLKELHVYSKKNFNLSFSFYISLLECFSYLFSINTGNDKKRQNILLIIDIITESINTIKVLGILDIKQMSILSIYQGKILLTYSNVMYIEEENRSCEDLIEECTYILNKQIDGYFFISNFSDDKEYEEIFLENTTRTLLLMLMKLQKTQEYSFDALQHIIYVYNNDIKKEKNTFLNEKEFKKDLFKNYLSLHLSYEKLNTKEAIEDIISNNSLSSYNLRLMHDFILFDESLGEELLAKIFNFMIKSNELKKEKNEVHKLKILDVILHKFVANESLSYFLPYAHTLKQYLNKKEIFSYKEYSFSKLHLSLSYYYSLLGKEYLRMSLLEYYTSEKISSYTYIKHDNKDIYKKLLLNNAQAHFASLGLEENFSDNEHLFIGDVLMKDYFIHHEVFQKNTKQEENPLFLKTLLSKTKLSVYDLEKGIPTLLKNNLFFTLFDCSLEKTITNENDFIILDKELIEGFMIVLHVKNSKIKNLTAFNENSMLYIKSTLIHLLLSYILKMKKPEHYNNFLQIDEYISL